MGLGQYNIVAAQCYVLPKGDFFQQCESMGLSSDQTWQMKLRVSLHCDNSDHVLI